MSSQERTAGSGNDATVSDAELYKNTFGRSQAEKLSFQLAADDAAQSTSKGKERAREEKSRSSRTIDAYLPWNDDEDRTEVYRTPLTPRVRDHLERRTDVATRGTVRRKRSFSLGDIRVNTKGHQYTDNAPSIPRRQDLPRAAAAVEMAEAKDQPSDPKTSTYVARGRSPAPTTVDYASEGNVSFRNRAFSAPTSALYAGPGLVETRASEEENRRASKVSTLRYQVTPRASIDATTIYRPARSRPLSFPSVGVPATANNRASLSAVSQGMAPSFVMPWDPAQSTALSLRYATMEGLGRMSDERYRAVSTASTRPSLNYAIMLHNRAQARYHLGALDLLRPRIPSESSANLSAIRYRSWFPTLHHTFLCLLTYAHVPVTLFLEYNTLFSIVEVAAYPEAGQGDTSAAWWIATGIYSAAFIAWLVGVVIVWEIIVEYQRRWSSRE
jgi:hypothetical protein